MYDGIDISLISFRFRVHTSIYLGINEIDHISSVYSFFSIILNPLEWMMTAYIIFISWDLMGNFALFFSLVNFMKMKTERIPCSWFWHENPKKMQSFSIQNFMVMMGGCDYKVGSSKLRKLGTYIWTWVVRILTVEKYNYFFRYHPSRTRLSLSCKYSKIFPCFCVSPSVYLSVSSVSSLNPPSMIIVFSVWTVSSLSIFF